MDDEMRKLKLLKKISWINTQMMRNPGTHIRTGHFERAKTLLKKRLSKLK